MAIQSSSNIRKSAQVVLHSSSATSSVAHAKDSRHTSGCILDVRHLQASHVVVVFGLLLLLEDPQALLPPLLLKNSVQFQRFLDLPLLLASWAFCIESTILFVCIDLRSYLVLQKLLVNLAF